MDYFNYRSVSYPFCEIEIEGIDQSNMGKRNVPITRFGSFWGQDELKFWFKQFILTDSDQFPNPRSVKIQ